MRIVTDVGHMRTPRDIIVTDTWMLRGLLQMSVM